LVGDALFEVLVPPPTIATLTRLVGMGLSSLFASRFVQQISSWRTVLLQQRAKDNKAYQRPFGDIAYLLF
jgi:hypothetical protein